MIYVTVGKMPLSFDRLVRAADELAALSDEAFFIQRGSGRYRPSSAPYADFLEFAEAEDLLRRARLVVSHAGIGTIIGALRAGTPIVVMPRRRMHREHFDDHQLEIAGALEGRPGVEVISEAGELKGAVERLAAAGRPPPSLAGRGLVEEIGRFLEGLEGRD